MASSKVIATTWNRDDLLNKLRATLKRMDDEINQWEKENITLEKRQAAWDKKAEAWAKKNLAKAEVSVDVHGYGKRGISIRYSFKGVDAEEQLGDRPTQSRRPNYKEGNHSNDYNSDYDQVSNAIALIEGSVDTEFKINTTSVWAQFIR